MSNCKLLLVGAAIFLTAISADDRTPPNIIFILADDLGFNDVGFHGSNQIPTPNIDALAYNGVILNNYYVNAMCTPSRTALMTGKYPIHTGMQHADLFAFEPRGLPLSEKLLPQYLKELGYVNRMIGKWHLGYYKKEYTPLFRGFDSHLGSWSTFQDYYDHTVAPRSGGWGLDMRNNMSVAYDLHGKYSTDIFTDESVRLINEHNTDKPLFLYLSHVAVHSGNRYNPLPAPDEEIAKFSYIEDDKRRRFAAMLSKLDASVGAVVEALQQKNMLENSIIVFSTDNGGASEGFNLNYGSNYPLRGMKATLWEGGNRGAALVWSPLIKKPARVASQLMQIADWLPTLIDAAGGNVSSLTGLDGVSVWDALSADTESPRKEVLLNIDEIRGNSGIRVGSLKLIQGNSSTLDGAVDGWYGPSGRDYEYNISLVQNSPAALALKSLETLVDVSTIENLRKEATVDCGNLTRIECNSLEAPCLFNLTEDPCERHNLAAELPNYVEELKKRIVEYNATAVHAANVPVDPKGDPKFYNYVVTNFGDEVVGAECA